MQNGMPEAGVAAIDKMYAVVHEREYLRSAAIDLIRAGLPSNVAADICDFARTRRRECSMLKCCADSRCALSVDIGDGLVIVLVHSGTRVAAELRLHPGSCEIARGGWREVHKGPLRDMPRTFHSAAMAMLEMAVHFSTRCSRDSRVISEAAEYVRDLRDPPPEWWVRDYIEIDLAHVSDAEVVVRGRVSCEACYVWWKEFCGRMDFMTRDPLYGEMNLDARN